MKKDGKIEQYKLCVEDGGDVQEDEAAEWVQARTFWVIYFSHPLFFPSQIRTAFKEKNV